MTFCIVKSGLSEASFLGRLSPHLYVPYNQGPPGYISYLQRGPRELQVKVVGINGLDHPTQMKASRIVWDAVYDFSLVNVSFLIQVPLSQA